MKDSSQQQERKSFSGCCLSLQLNGLNVLTIDEADFIKAVLSFVAQKERQEKEAARCCQ